MDIFRVEEAEEEERDSQETVKETTVLAIHEEKPPKVMRWSWNTFIACLCLCLVSLAGGAILVFWVVKHHPTNTQLWMVPVGLILFSTPVFISVASIVSDLCCPVEGNHNVLLPQPQL